MIERTRLDFSREKQVLVNLIVNTKYCKEVLPVVENEYFKAKSAVAIIRWVKEYFNAYNEAPGRHINDIFDEKSDALEPEERDQIGAVLQHVSDIADTENKNTQYLVDTAFKLFEERLLELQVFSAQNHINNHRYDLAKEALSKRFEVKNSKSTADRWDDDDAIRRATEYLVKVDDPEEAFFRYPGRLGDFIGNMERSWFVSFIAPSKRGKTIYMIESIITAIRRNLNVVFFSLEMPKEQVLSRALTAVVSNKPGDKSVETMTPIMDCLLNQKGECTKQERTGFDRVLHEDVRTPYDEFPDWKVCTACRGKKDFVPCGWKIPITRPAMNEGQFIKEAKNFLQYYGKRCRTFFYPSKTATVLDFRNDLAQLEESENFIADVIVIDYFDLIKPTRAAEKRHALDDIGEELRALEQEKQVLLITGSQTNRGAADSPFIKDTDIGEDYSKIFKLDLGIGLCQIKGMKENGEMNINKVVFRHGEFSQSRTCLVLQHLEFMQAALDAEFQVY